MLSPGSATALVNDALEWLNPHVLQMLPRRDAVEDASRGAVSKAPEMLCSALAAVLSFLDAHVIARQAPGDISSITKALLDSSILPRDAASPQLLNLLSQCSAPQPSEAQHSAASDSDPQKRTQDSAPQGSAAQALPVSQTSAGAYEMLLAVACLGRTLAQHKALDAQILDSLNAGIINALSGQVSRLLCTAAIIITGLQFLALVSGRSSAWYAAKPHLDCR
jgi:type IV secretory pathway VirB2 component (pilin)